RVRIWSYASGPGSGILSTALPPSARRTRDTYAAVPPASGGPALIAQRRSSSAIRPGSSASHRAPSPPRWAAFSSTVSGSAIDLSAKGAVLSLRATATRYREQGMAIGIAYASRCYFLFVLPFLSVPCKSSAIFGRKERSHDHERIRGKAGSGNGRHARNRRGRRPSAPRRRRGRARDRQVRGEHGPGGCLLRRGGRADKGRGGGDRRRRAEDPRRGGHPGAQRRWGATARQQLGDPRRGVAERAGAELPGVRAAGRAAGRRDA